NSRGVKRVEAGKVQEGIDDYNVALACGKEKADPSYSVILGNRGIAKERLGDYRGAINDINASLRLNDGHALVYAVRGAARRHLGDLESAIKDLTIAITRSDEELDLACFYNNRGYTYFLLGHAQKAIEDYQKAIDVKPSDVVFINNLGDAWFSLGDKEKAIHAYKRVLAVSPTCAYALARLKEIQHRGQNCLSFLTPEEQ
ncbi:MAG: tetratricopeptide repeat protein, partial [Nanoarchaeota archaeon]|nr:tetratricopeptide repeat protein [Nanoarchaeota archaeon]